MIPGKNGAMERQTGLGETEPQQTKLTSKDVRDLVERQQYRCAMTGRQLTPDVAFVDHVFPVSRGGAHSIENLQVVHADVNEAKGTMTPAEFITMCRDVVAWVDGHGYSAGVAAS